MFINVEERKDGTYNDYGVERTRYTPTMYIDVDDIFIRQGLRELPLHEYIHDLIVVAMKEIVNEHCK